MLTNLSRRDCLALAILPTAAIPWRASGVQNGSPAQPPPGPATPATATPAATAPPAGTISLVSFPSQDPALAREIVGASHGNLERVSALLKNAPRLANTSYDWGFGDWETPLGAASHTGRIAIAEQLLENGARPDIFAFAMLGKLDAVKAMIEAQPGLERTRGPHGLTLAHHARQGGEGAVKVVEYLVSLPGADLAYAETALSKDEGERFVGSYAYAPGNTERFTIAWAKTGDRLTIQRTEGVSRTLYYQGSRQFHPVGAPECRVTFSIDEPCSRRVTITSPAPVLTAERV